MISNSYFRAYVILGQNGPAVYCTWTVIASLLNLIHALHYSGGVDMTVCCNISLSILTIAVLAWSVLENIFLDKWVRFIITPFIGKRLNEHNIESISELKH